MTEATLLWSIWQALLRPFVWAFTRLGYRRFVEWVTALALNVEEHTITQSVLALDRPADWKALESFAEYGAWDAPAVTGNLTRLVAQAPGRIWHGYHVSAVDDTKVHRNSQDVWGTCTFHEYTARCPNRATTVRRTTGSSSGHCWRTPVGLPGSSPSPGGSTSASRSYPLGAGPSAPGSHSAPSANWSSNCCGSRPGSSPGGTWASSTAATPCRASCGRW